MMKLEVPTQDHQSLPKAPAQRHESEEASNTNNGTAKITDSDQKVAQGTGGEQPFRYRGRYGSNLAQSGKKANLSEQLILKIKNNSNTRVAQDRKSAEARQGPAVSNFGVDLRQNNDQN